MAEKHAYTQAVARNIITARTRCRGLTQTGLASRMQALGFDWRQQTVARVELAKRPVEPDEVLGLALALETTIQELLSPSESDRDRLLALPSGETVSPDFVTSLVYGMNAGAVTWNDGKPEFDPVTQRDNYALKFVEVMRSASSSRPVEISYQDARGSAVTVRMPPGPSSQAHPISGDHDEEPGPGLLHFQPNTTES